MEKQMVKVSVEVRNRAARFRVGVRAGSLREALALVGETFPRREARVVYPIEPEGYFVGETAAAGMSGTEQGYLKAA